MAFVTPATRSTGDLITSAIWNQDVVANPKVLDPSAAAAGDVPMVNAGLDGYDFAPVTLQSIIQDAIETGSAAAIARLGPSQGNVASGDNVGLGFDASLGSGATLTRDTTYPGAWLHSTGATNGADAGFKGTSFISAADWTFVWKGILSNEADRTVFIGGRTSGNFGDQNNIVGFRVLTSGSIVGVCDSGGTETTRDTSVTPDGATVITLRVEVRSGGTVVRFYKDNVQVGADVTTNIPSGALIMAEGLENATTADKVMRTIDAAYWREAA